MKEQWWWARRDNRWDVYPQEDPLVLVRAVDRGVTCLGSPIHDLFYENGAKVRQGMILVRHARLEELNQ